MTIQSYDYTGFSRLAGEAEPAPDGSYRVRLKPLSRRRPIRTLLIAAFAFCFEATFFGWLLAEVTLPDRRMHTWLFATTVFMIAATALIELFRLVNVVTLCLATLRARDPIPVEPQPGLRVAFLTTIVPGKEPI